MPATKPATRNLFSPGMAIDGGGFFPTHFHLMVHITLTGAGGNGARFGYDGFLGLTPVVVRGTVATHIDSDGKPMMARALTAHVRCYEVRHSRFGQTHSHVMADHVQTLWSSPHEGAAPLGEFESPFRIVVPVESAGASTAAFPANFLSGVLGRREVL